MSGMFAQIEAKIAAAERLSAAEGQFLFSPQADLHAVGQLADEVRRRKNGAAAYYNINAHLNPTNVCVYRCPLCAFSCDPGDAKAYLMSEEQILACGQEAVDAGCTELHLVGGLHPAQPLDWHVDIVRLLHEAHPRLHLKAFTAVEIDWFSRLAQRPVAAVLEELVAAGLGSLPGGARKSSPRKCGDKSVRARSTRRRGWPSIGPPTGSDCAPTPRCSTATWKRPRSESITSSRCAISRTPAAVSRR